jgi:hypothetical protein
MTTTIPTPLSKRGCAGIAFCLCLVAWSAAKATPIAIDLGPSPNITSHVETMFSDLNGTQLRGQTLSLDFLFTNAKFVRLFTVTDPGFAILITLNTSGSGVVGFLDGTGYLLNQSGGALGMPQPLGSASGDDGSMSAGLFPLLSGQFSTPLDFFGVHTNLLLPTNSSITVTGGEFQLVSVGANKQDVFGIGPGVPRNIVPDSGSTLLLLSVIFLALPTLGKRVSTAYKVS